MVQVLSARLRKLRPAEEFGGTSEVVLCYGLFVVSWTQIPKKRTKLFGWICGRSTERPDDNFAFPADLEQKGLEIVELLQEAYKVSRKFRL